MYFFFTWLKKEKARTRKIIFPGRKLACDLKHMSQQEGSSKSGIMHSKYNMMNIAGVVWFLLLKMLMGHRHIHSLPHPADASGGQGSGHYLWPLLHEATHREPEAVSQGVLVFQHVPVFSQTWVRVIPLIWAQPGRERTMIWLWGQTPALSFTCVILFKSAQISHWVRVKMSAAACVSHVAGDACLTRQMATEHGCELWTIVTVCDVMHGPCSQEENTADSQVGEQHEEPDGWREGIKEGEVARLPALVVTWMDRNRRTDRQTERQEGVLENKVSLLTKKVCPPFATGGQCPALLSDCPQCLESLMHYTTIHK